MPWPFLYGPANHLFLVTNEENIGHALCLMDVAKGFSSLCSSFATLDLHKLIVRQVKPNDGHCLFDTILERKKNQSRIYIRRWSILGFIHNVPKVHGSYHSFWTSKCLTSRHWIYSRLYPPRPQMIPSYTKTIEVIVSKHSNQPYWNDYVHSITS